MHARDGLTFAHIDHEFLWEDAFHGGGFNERHEFQVAFDAGEIEAEQILAGFHVCPHSDSFDWNNAVGGNADALNAEGWIGVNVTFEQIFPAFPADHQAENDAGGDGEGAGGHAQANGMKWFGTRTHFELPLALKLPGFFPKHVKPWSGARAPIPPFSGKRLRRTFPLRPLLSEKDSFRSCREACSPRERPGHFAG